MVINSIGINKTKPPILTNLTEHKKATTYNVGNQDPGLEQVQKCAGLNLLMDHNPPLLRTENIHTLGQDMG